MNAIATRSRPCPRTTCDGTLTSVEVRFVGVRAVYVKQVCEVCGWQSLPRARAAVPASQRPETEAQRRRREAAEARAEHRRRPWGDGPAPWAK